MKYTTHLSMGMMFFLSFAPLISQAASSSGCGAEGWSSGIHTMQHSGVTRTFKVHVPKSYSKDNSTPLVSIFHGWGGDENEFLKSKAVTSEADKLGFILVAPRGLGSGSPDYSNNSWSFSGSTTGADGVGGPICDHNLTADYSYSSCALVKKNTCSWTQCQVNDLDFAIALIDLVKQNLCIDNEKVFATGGSNGGMFTWGLGQNPQSASTFRAIAPLIGLPHKGYLEPQGKRDKEGKVTDLPVLVITGAQDNVVPPGAWEDVSFTTTSNGNDRFYYTGATAIAQSWAGAHGCDVSSDAISFDDGNRETDCRTYCSGDPGWPRVLDCRAKMGHAYELQWSWKLILNFFEEHSN